MGRLLLSGHIKKAICSYFTSNRDAVETWKRGELEIELLPQGTLAEAIRGGGAGIGGFYTRTALGTKLAEGKEVKEIDGDWYVFEKMLEFFGYDDWAKKVLGAIEAVMVEGKVLTPDMGGSSSTEEVGRRIVEMLS